MDDTMDGYCDVLLLKKFINLEKDENEDFLEYVHRREDLYKKVQGAGFNFEKKVLMGLMLIGLPMKYEPLRKATQIDDDSVTPASLIIKLAEEERRLKHTDATNNAVLYTGVPLVMRNLTESSSSETLCSSDTDSQIETDEEMDSKSKDLHRSVNINDDSWDVDFQPDTELKPTASPKPFTCEVCEFNKANGGVLRSHLKTYNDDEKYTCEACNFKSAYKEDLESHLKTFCKLTRIRLSIIKPFICDICDFRCAQKRSLEVHTRTHTVEKPFSCQVCNFRSAYKEDLRSHLKTFCKLKMIH